MNHREVRISSVDAVSTSGNAVLNATIHSTKTGKLIATGVVLLASNTLDRVVELRGPVPIPMRLECPGTVERVPGHPEKCGVLHIDEGEFATKPHHTHSCQSCGHTWRQAVVPTVGVRFLPGFKNAETETPAPSGAGAVAAEKWGPGAIRRVLAAWSGRAART